MVGVIEFSTVLPVPVFCKYMIFGLWLEGVLVSIMRSRRIPNIALEALVDIYIISSCQDNYGWESLTHVESEIRVARFYMVNL